MLKPSDLKAASQTPFIRIKFSGVGICLWTEWGPLPNTTQPDYAFHVGGTAMEALYGVPHLCFPARICLQHSSLSLWIVTPLKQIFLASSGLAACKRWGRSTPRAPRSGQAGACWQHLSRISPLTQFIYPQPYAVIRWLCFSIFIVLLVTCSWTM